MTTIVNLHLSTQIIYQDVRDTNDDNCNNDDDLKSRLFSLSLSLSDCVSLSLCLSICLSVCLSVSLSGRVWRIGRDDAFRPKGHGFDSGSSHQVGTLSPWTSS